ncbi:hypothetical protein DL96DRAFT_602686 [Flagelloscypha sp. PMI_526]|nr:hypothetical protein DL96DRAFT_602686 [Flagelloscypha sp. PMI_526]
MTGGGDETGGGQRWDVTPRPSIAPQPTTATTARSNPSQQHHTLYSQTLSSRASTHTFGAPSSNSSISGASYNYEGDYEFSSSDEELDGSYYGYYDERENENIDVEVSSAVYEPSIDTHEGRWNELVHNSDTGSTSGAGAGAWRPREDSVATVRANPSHSHRTSAPPPPMTPIAITGNAASFDPAELGNWTQSLANGITNFSLDDTDDIIASSSPITGSAPYLLTTPTTSNSRRPSAVRIGIPGWLSGVGAARRPSTATVTSMNTVNLDSFNLGLKVWANTLDAQERKDWTFVKDKADSQSTNLSLSPTSSRSTVRSPRLSVSGEKAAEDATALTSGAVREPKREWKGMAINSQEIWGMRHSGRYKVDRRILVPGNATKAPQQRIDIQSYRDPYFMSDGPQVHEGPVATIHKHSKVAAFSISRSFKLRPLVIVRSPTSTITNVSTKVSLALPRESTSTASTLRPGTSASSRVISPTATVSSMKRATPSGGGGGKMILLAPKKVQIAFTSTTTTRNLMSHGLLDDGRNHSHGNGTKGRSTSVDPDRRRKEKERMRKDRKGMDQLLGTASSSTSLKKKKEKDKDKDKDKDKSATTPNSSFGSVSSTTTSSSSNTSASLHTYPPPPPPPPRPGSSASSSQYNTVFNFNHTSGRRRSLAGPHASRSPSSDSDSDEEEDESGRRRKKRQGLATHAEAYGAIDPTAFEAMAASPYLNPHHQQKGGVLKKLLGGSGRGAVGSGGGQLKNRELENLMYHPPWMVMASRDKQEEQAKVVETLNASFKDVGLLPSTQRTPSSLPSSATSSVSSVSSRRSVPPSSTSSSSRTRNTTPRSTPRDPDRVDIFEEIPADSLFMLLPLWPGETDPVTERSGGGSTENLPKEETTERQYLLVYFKRIIGAKEALKDASSAVPPLPSSKDASSPSSSSSHDHHTYHPPPPHTPSSAKTILLSSFTITARLVKYPELQGSGLRLPEEGMSVVGDLTTAWEFKPGKRDAGGGASAGSGPGTSVASSIPEEDGTSSEGGVEVGGGGTSANGAGGLGEASARDCLVDWVIGACSSRDGGIEFYPNGLARLGLCVEKPYVEDVPESDFADVQFAGGLADTEGERVSINAPSNGSDPGGWRRRGSQVTLGSQGEREPQWELTQVGKAVTEMVWLGGVALTSFGGIVQ